MILDEKHISFRRAYITYLEDAVDRGKSGGGGVPIQAGRMVSMGSQFHKNQRVMIRKVTSEQ